MPSNAEGPEERTVHSVEIILGDEPVVLQTGKVAKQADGAVWVQQGGTVVLVTAVAAAEAKEDTDFFPLTVDYRERGYAVGKIPPVYGRREPRPGVGETLIARLIDHSIRPLFPKKFRNETQVQAMTLSSDQVHPTETLAMIGTSAALSISSIPFNGPIGGIVVARVGGAFVANPTYAQLDEADLHFFVTANKRAVMSVEGSAHEVPEDDVIAAIDFAHGEIQRVIAVQEELVAAVGKPKRPVGKASAQEEMAVRIRELATMPIRQSIGIADKQERDTYLQSVLENVVAEIEGEGTDIHSDDEQIAAVFTEIEREEMRRSILEEGKRVDGRGTRDIRDIACEVGVLPRTHGSSLFTRGQTQALCTVTLGTGMDEEVIRDLTGEHSRAFFLHYNFPGFSVGEVRRITGAGRREIGHGSLAEHALMPVIPDAETFPYTVRVVSEILESNASSSMATVCGASLALMDAGVPVAKPVAGVGVGLIKDGDREVILTDMLGAEDHLGDMDFKVAGTRDGVTAIQLDIKIDGITVDLMRRAIHQSHEARIKVLDLMDACIGTRREDISPYAPRIYTMKVHPDKIREIIGRGGSVIRKIQEDAGVTVNVEDDGTVRIASTSLAAAKVAEDIIRGIVAEAEVGKEYVGRVTRVTPFGAFVEVLKGVDGLIHISALSDGYVRRVEDVLNIGDTATVRVTRIDEKGRIDLELVTRPDGTPMPPRAERVHSEDADEEESDEPSAPRVPQYPRATGGDRAAGSEPSQETGEREPQYEADGSRQSRDRRGGDRDRGSQSGGRPRDGRGGSRETPRVPKRRY
ncbi:polyribonucleotide nucleotidyltransferase [Candidatus Poribacteria bacterium]|nr:polyribonucleotide nucleotidyltransferase [Candidatus Poribacteria bacterium]